MGQVGSVAYCSKAMAIYPPANHLLRDLLLTSYWATNDEVRFVAPVVDALRDQSGAMATGPLFAMLDMACAHRAMHEAEGDWAGTIDLSFSSGAPLTEGPIVIASTVLRTGRRLITARCDVFDGHGAEEPGTLCGTATGTFNRMRRDLARDDETTATRTMGERQTWALESSGFERSLAEKMGWVQIGPGVIELSKSDYVTNSFGTVNGGASAILSAVAAESAVGPSYAARDLSIRYIGRAGEGSVRAESTVVRVDEHQAVVDVNVIDLSADGRLVTVATIGLRRL